MSIWRLVFREIWYRKGGFGVAVVAVAVAVGCLVAQLGLLRAHDLHAQRRIAAARAGTADRMRQAEQETQARTAKFEADTRARMDAVMRETAERVEKAEADYKKITNKLGFNVLILHKD